MKKIILTMLLLISSVYGQKISTYLYGDLQSIDQIKTNLNKTGFQVVGEYDAMANSSYHVIVYTSNDLKRLGSKQDRGFVSVGKILISKNDNKLIFTNPAYFIRAFMQDELDNTLVSVISAKLNNSFPSLTPSEESLEDDKLANYHFMFAMPYYEDMIEVASGDNLNETLEKNAKGKIVYKINLRGSTLYGIYNDGIKGEKQYISAINQEKNSAFLPYMVLISNGKAKILHPKYYLAISLPNLTMGQFMTISDTPSNIEDYFKALFK